MYRKKDGICIGPCIAPNPCDLYLVMPDRNIQCDFVNQPVKRSFMYVDGFLTLHDSGELFVETKVRERVRNLLGEGSTGLTITSESADHGTLTFLDLTLQFDKGHTCWWVSPRSKQGLFPLDSAPFHTG